MKTSLLLYTGWTIILLLLTLWVMSNDPAHTYNEALNECNEHWTNQMLSYCEQPTTFRISNYSAVINWTVS